MKFNELAIGQWFKTDKDSDDKIRYMKISPPIEDKFGNTIVAVNNCGFAMDADDIANDSDVIPLECE